MNFARSQVSPDVMISTRIQLKFFFFAWLSLLIQCFLATDCGKCIINIIASNVKLCLDDHINDEFKAFQTLEKLSWLAGFSIRVEELSHYHQQVHLILSQHHQWWLHQPVSMPGQCLHQLLLPSLQCHCFSSRIGFCNHLTGHFPHHLVPPHLQQNLEVTCCTHFIQLLLRICPLCFTMTDQTFYSHFPIRMILQMIQMMMTVKKSLTTL